MELKTRKSEAGQAIVYLVIGFVVFLGFVAIAIDGGMILADRRNSQNVADAASLAGGGAGAYRLEEEFEPGVGQCYGTWVCNSDTTTRDLAEIYAYQRAEENDLPASNVQATCGSIDYGPYTDKFIDVTVEVTSTTKSNFVQLVYPDALVNFVDAVTRVHPRQPAGFGMAVIGLNPNICGGNNGVKVNGGPYAYVNGGGIFSNGCINGNGSPGDVVVVDGGVSGHYLDPGGTSWDPVPEFTDLTLEPADYAIPAPLCLSWENDLPNTNPIPPGLYCIKKPMTISSDMYGVGITIYTKDNISYAGNKAVHLEAPPIGSTPVGGAIPGVLIYMDAKSNPPNLSLAGNADDAFIGMIYAPYSSISLTGTANPTFTGQIIGFNVKIGGDDTFKINYDGCNTYTRATWLELNK